MPEFIVQFVGEFLLQLVFEALAEIGLHSLAEPFRSPPNPWLAALGYALLGSIAGGLTLLFFPSHLIVNKAVQVINLAVTPLAIGLAMAQLGAWRVRRGQPVLRIDRFAYGYLFALALAVIRFWLAK